MSFSSVSPTPGKSIIVSPPSFPSSGLIWISWISLVQAETLLTGATSRPNNALHNDDLSTPVVPKIPTRGVYPFILFYFIFVWFFLYYLRLVYQYFSFLILFNKKDYWLIIHLFCKRYFIWFTKCYPELYSDCCETKALGEMPRKRNLDQIKNIF